LSGVVYSHSIRVGGDAFDDSIINYVRRNYGMLIGEATAEEIKKSIGSAFPGMEVRELEVKGRNLAEGIPRAFTISSNEVLEALTEPLNQIVQSVKNALEQTPPELGADIADRGLVLTGGGIVGKVVSISDAYVTVEVAANTQIVVQKQAIGAVLPKGTLKSI